MNFTITAWLMPFPDGSQVVALGFLEGLMPNALLLICVEKTPMTARTFLGKVAIGMRTGKAT